MHEQDHTHEHANGCSCGCGHAHHHHHEDVAHEGISNGQWDFLRHLRAYNALPVGQFVVQSSKQADFCFTALSPFFLCEATDGMEDVQSAGAFLLDLEDMGLITLDFDIPLREYAYEEYYKSDVYAQFCQTVRDAAKQPGFVGDTPAMELGSMALTEKALALLDETVPEVLDLEFE